MGICRSRARYVRMEDVASPQSQGDANSANGSPGEGQRLCGPSQIQVLRGKHLDREVVLFLCSESHEDAIDLTRENAVVDQYEDWISCQAPNFNTKSAWKSKKGLSEDQAKVWASKQLKNAEDDDEDMSKDGAMLVFVAEAAEGKGKCYLFVPDLVECREGALPEKAVAYEWGDLDDEAREFRRRRKARQEMPVEELDLLLEKRKQDRRKEGLQLFDDWLIHQIQTCDFPVEVVLESPVPAEEVEIELQDVAPAPPAHSSLRGIELDSDSDSDDENDGGTDSFIDYLRRRLSTALPAERLHCADPRELGEGSEELSLRDAFQRLLSQPRPKDMEEVELDSLGASYPDDEEPEDGQCDETSRLLPAVPSFEAFFGAASDVLYYHPEVKMDYAPFLHKCVGSAEALEQFFDRLFFGTVPEALAELTLTEETRPFTRIRSLIYERKGLVQRRPKERPPIPVKVLPMDCFLVASKSEPPRTWVSGLAQRVLQLGGEDLVKAAHMAYQIQVKQLLADPKNADQDGDYFEAWLRECHPHIYEDIDTSDPAELVKKSWVASESKPQRKHKLSEICIPNVHDAFKELMNFDPDSRITTKRERVIAKILEIGRAHV